MKKSLLHVVAVCGGFVLNGCGAGTPPATHLSLSTLGAATAGTPFNVTVSALDASNNVVTNYSGTVHFTSSDGQAVLPPDSPLTHGTGTFSVTFKTHGNQTITATDTAGRLTAGTSNSSNVSPGSVAQFSFSVPSMATSGTSFSLTVNALDASNNMVSAYAGTVHFTSSDAQAMLPQNSTLTNGTGNFSVTLKTSGTQTITATDAATAFVTSTSSAIAVSPGPAVRLSVTGYPVSINTRASFHFAVSAVDAANNVATGYSGTVHFTSTDSQAMLPANSRMTAGTSSFSATLETAGNQTVTTTDTAMASITGSSSSIAVTAVPPLAITSGAPPNGTVGVNYGPSKRQYFLCRIMQAVVSCTPCTPGVGGTCGSYPGCARFQPTYPCISTRLVFGGFTFTATGGVSPYTWSVSGLPTTLNVNPSNGETIGTPTSPGTFNISATATDSGLPTAQIIASYTLTIAPPPLPVVSATPAPPSGVENQPYTFTFTASGYPPLTWSESGALPNGLTFDTSTGVLSGTPTVANTFPITITAIDQFKQNSSAAAFDIVIYAHGFVPTGGMGAARIAATATLLSNGMVLVAGGTDGGGNALATAELYDPAAASFSPAGSMGAGRAHFAAVLLNTGKVLVVGGLDSAGNPLATAELYDPTAKTFSPTAGSMTIARASLTATLLDTKQATDKVLIAGWGNATAELFDPVTATFAATTGSMVQARVSHTATLLSNGKVLLTGGIQGVPPATTTLAEAELYDPAAGKFSQTAGSMATARQWHTATLLASGKVLVTGGLDSTGKSVGTAELFDLTAQSFTPTTGNMVSPRAFHTATLLGDNTVLLAGGVDTTNNAIASAEIYDPASGNFASTGGLVTARQQHTATLLQNGKVLVTGGLDTGALATAELYQ